MFADAFQGSGVPLAGDPVTSFELVPLIGLRAGTVVDNSRPEVRDVIKARFIATNCGERPIEIVRSIQNRRDRDDDYWGKNSTSLLPGESLEFCTFRSWDAPGKHQLTVAYAVRCAGHPFARLTYPIVAIHVGRPLMPWMLWVRATQPQAR